MGSLPKLDELQSIVERISDLGSWAWTFDTKRIWWSDQTYRILGLRPGEVQPTVKAWLARIHPDDRERMSERARTERERGGGDYEYRLLIDGGVRWVRTHTMLRMTGDVPTDLVGTIQDITRTRLQAEATEKQLARTESLAHLGTWTWSATTGEVECTPELWAITGRPPGEASVELFDEIVHPDDLPRLFDARRYARDTGRVAPMEVRIRRPDGTERIVLFRGTSEGDRFVGIFQDVTDQRRLEARVRWAEALSTTGRLAEGIAHEFNNMLTVVLGHARVLYNRDPNDDLRAIIDAAESGAELTRRLQVFGSDSKRQPKPVQVEQVITDCTRMLARLMKDELDVRFVPSFRTTNVWLDPALLHRVILGVAVHARDTVASTSLQITTNVETRDGQPGVCIAMEDDGSGILDEEPSPLATPLGLSAVRQVAAEVGAQLAVSATPGVGTIVTLWLPRTDREESTLPPIRHRARDITVLVVEDEPLVRRLIARVLEGAGYEVHLTTGPKEALASVEFDLLVTDLTMPDGGGRRVVREMRERHPSVPVLYLTGFTPDPSALDAPVLLKPFRPHELLEAIELVLAESTSQN